MEPANFLKSHYHFLMVDDDEDDQMLICSAFKDIGYPSPIQCFNNAVDMLNYLRTLRDSAMPVLILMDLNMPKKDGKSVLSEIRKNPKLSHADVIIYSTSNSDQDITETYALGCNAYIVKPNCYEDIKKIARGIKSFWIDNLFRKFKVRRALVPLLP